MSAGWASLRSWGGGFGLRLRPESGMAVIGAHGGAQTARLSLNRLSCDAGKGIYWAAQAQPGVRNGHRDAALEEFAQIVAGADEQPLPLHLGQAAKQELAEAPALLDLAADRFLRGHSQGIPGLSAPGAQLPPHALAGTDGRCAPPRAGGTTAKSVSSCTARAE